MWKFLLTQMYECMNLLVNVKLGKLANWRKLLYRVRELQIQEGISGRLRAHCSYLRDLKLLVELVNLE